MVPRSIDDSELKMPDEVATDDRTVNEAVLETVELIVEVVGTLLDGLEASVEVVALDVVLGGVVLDADTVLEVKLEVVEEAAFFVELYCAASSPQRPKPG